MSKTLLGCEPRYDTGWHSVADGVYAWLQPNGDWGESNAGLIVSGEESLQVDTLYDELLTQRMLDAIADLPGPPPVPSMLVNTHGDYDHVSGNALFAGKPIYATKAAIEQCVKEPPKLGAALTMASAAGARGSGLASRLGSGMLGRAAKNTTTSAAFINRMLVPYDLAHSRHHPPTDQVGGTSTIHVGGRDVSLIEVGSAHSPGDLMVHVPDAKVLFAGDLLFVDVTPISWSGPMESWLAALDLMTELQPDHVVPGHGPVATLEEVEMMRAYWHWLGDAAKVGSAKSVMDRSRQILASEEFASLPWAHWDSPERILVNIEMLEKTSGMGNFHPSPPVRLKLLGQMGMLAGELEESAKA